MRKESISAGACGKRSCSGGEPYRKAEKAVKPQAPKVGNTKNLGDAAQPKIG